jgi:hypothetical protein
MHIGWLSSLVAHRMPTCIMWKWNKSKGYVRCECAFPPAPEVDPCASPALYPNRSRHESKERGTGITWASPIKHPPRRYHQCRRRQCMTTQAWVMLLLVSSSNRLTKVSPRGIQGTSLANEDSNDRRSVMFVTWMVVVPEAGLWLFRVSSLASPDAASEPSAETPLSCEGAVKNTS